MHENSFTVRALQKAVSLHDHISMSCILYIYIYIPLSFQKTRQTGIALPQCTRRIQRHHASPQCAGGMQEHNFPSRQRTGEFRDTTKQRLVTPPYNYP